MSKKVTARDVIKELNLLSSKEKKITAEKFFKTEAGQYGEGDVFIGISVPDQRKVAKRYVELSFDEVAKMLESNIHEYRLTALLLLVEKYKVAEKENNNKDKKNIYTFYKKHIAAVNNWDLVDCSAPYIMGTFLLEHESKRKDLYVYAKAKHLWKNRIAMVSTWWLIRNKEYEDALKLAEQFLDHEHDLMHKATGWMLREVGRQHEKKLITFLNKHFKVMPRTMLRYAIERLSPQQKKKYMQK